MVPLIVENWFFRAGRNDSSMACYEKTDTNQRDLKGNPMEGKRINYRKTIAFKEYHKQQ